VDSQLPVDVEGLVCLDLHLAYAIAGRDAFFNRRLEVVAPRTPVAVAVAVVVAAQEVAPRLGAFLHGKRDVDRFEEVFFERGVELNDVVDIALDVLGVQSAEEVAGLSVRLWTTCRDRGSLQRTVNGVRHYLLPWSVLLGNDDGRVAGVSFRS
jgi:hypothetical protein